MPVHAKRYARLSSQGISRGTLAISALCVPVTHYKPFLFSPLHILLLFSHKTFFPLSFERCLRSSSSDGAAAKDQAASAVGAEREVLRQHQNRGFYLTFSTSHKFLWCVTGWAYLSNPLKYSHTCHLPEVYTYHDGTKKLWIFQLFTKLWE